MRFLLLNDIHIGAVRSAGTTVSTRHAIQQYLQDALKDIIWRFEEFDLIINGDLFDGYEVDTGQLLMTYLTLHEWLTKNPKRIANLVRGNHDIAKNSQRTSSFALLCKLLETAFPTRVAVFDTGFAQIEGEVWVIPHCVNQDSFNVEIDNALTHVEEGNTPGFLLLHANFDNNFAVESDHSLNVSEEQARALIKSGWTLVFAHEHQKRACMGGNVQILGNQWPSSVSDCLAHGDAQKDGKKFAHLITSETTGDEYKLTLTPVETWDGATDFIAMDWKNIEQSDARFVRIEGKADAEQAADVISAVAKLRQHSKALVITNSVKIAGVAGVGEMLTLTADKLQTINVLEALCKELEPAQADKVCELLGEVNPLPQPVAIEDFMES